MTLNQALALSNSRKGVTPLRVHFLVCGFQPLHLATLLRAALLERFQGDVDLRTGLYGDFYGNLEAACHSGAVASAVSFEWSDLDPRLGLRAAGGWTSAVRASILADAPQRFTRLLKSLENLGRRMPVAILPPVLPLPPIGGTASPHRSSFDLELSQLLSSFLVEASHLPGIRIVVAPHPEPGTPTGNTVLDARMELMAGFPYTVAQANAMATSLAATLWPAPPKKGLITDLDDTLWHGIVGEIGPDAVSWSQESHSQVHGLYQQMLGQLSDSGILLAICSKNQLSTVETALQRRDLLVKPDAFFPVMANWGAKSAGIAQILRTWNIDADAVVFIDDNPMELEEVHQAFPGITPLLFRKKDPNAVWDLLGTLRDLFGRPVLTDEDRLRAASIRAGAIMKESAGEDSGSPEFLRSLDGTVTLTWQVAPSDTRPLELINKTNQFNLNGQRIAEGEWQQILQNPRTVLVVVSYADKFGPLGKIAVAVGTQENGVLHLTHWVMSCRAFSRKLEYHTLDGLFRTTGAPEIVFDVHATPKNSPLQEFLQAAGITPGEDGVWRLSRHTFESQARDLPHSVTDQIAAYPTAVDPKS